MVISVHALLRFLQRNYRIDVDRERAECSVRWGYHRAGLPVKDGILLKFISKRHPQTVELARDELADYVANQTGTFHKHDMRFVIKDNTLVTVFEQ